jgi:hypothetical protein
MPKHPLGRIVEHDPRSLYYPAPKTEQPRSAHWRHYGRILDQGQLGSCTGNAMTQWLMTGEAFRGRHHRPGRYLTETEAVRIYSAATKIDGAEGEYPPDDTGSSGLAVAKVAQQLGYVSRYSHAFGIDHAEATISLSAFLVGSEWTERMFDPDADGFVYPDGDVAGGHEYLCVGWDQPSDVWTFVNSWGADWGVAAKELGGFMPGGCFRMRGKDFAELLNRQGDITVPMLAL